MELLLWVLEVSTTRLGGDGYGTASIVIGMSNWRKITNYFTLFFLVLI